MSRANPIQTLNKQYGFPVMTSQEKELLLNQLVSTAQISDGVFEVSYSEKPQEEFCGDWHSFMLSKADKRIPKKRRSKSTPDETVQLTQLDN